MYKVCKTEKSMERQKLFQTTLLTMMKKQRYQDITVTSLCKEMNIPSNIEYINLDDIEELSIKASSEGNPLYPVPTLMNAKQLKEIYVLIKNHN